MLLHEGMNEGYVSFFVDALPSTLPLHREQVINAANGIGSIEKDGIYLYFQGLSPISQLDVSLDIVPSG